MEPKPILWRHHMAGVLLGTITDSPIPGHLRFDGVRIRSWRGGRTDCASVAVKGPADGDTITERVVRDVSLEGSVEIYETSAEHVAKGIAIAEKAT